MKIKLDENIPLQVKSFLESLGHDVDTVPEEGLTSKPDEIVWNTTQTAGRFLITQDLDFSDNRKFLPGTHMGILLVRLSTPGRMEVASRINSIFLSEDVETWKNCFVVLSDRKLRVTKQH
jgi:predicted nuclease of predicted toxin-antitoxin system